MQQLQLSRRVASSAPVSSRSAPCTSRRLRLGVQALLQQAEGQGVTWKQSVDDVRIKVPVGSEVRGRDLKFEVHPRRLSLRLGGQPLLEGSLTDAGEISVDDCFWTLETDEADGGSSKYVEIVLIKRSMGFNSWENLLESDKVDLTITDKCFLEVSIGGEPAGKIAVGLFGNMVPRTATNFKELCTGSKGVGTLGKPLHFQGSSFHRLIPGFMAQGGDITNNDGTGGESIYGPMFEDENFKVKHDEAGFLAMANAGPDTNTSQFYILFGPTPHLDGKHVVFGRVLAGMDVVRRMEACGSPSGTPTAPVSITNCGVLMYDGAVEAIMDANKMAMMDKLALE
eukprot:CAMPEP_0119108918 /NCGR_PEP_ID=MMETSP1180-20130426/16179_1 /TAXON_ID=3052 ORGANISM="Chlamydomonas cf sp, Strain CCMP681" /NCGR_SAMPLE_ID=MMETSP1180 /ASSEMBLY_ACC=CAM_ASM_000741 /LENGTH=339 /DNA_ID=CAMNT_0007094595 /DNA_START=13 /DNA_END=1032 /DNA_ORIENTATION=-